MRAVRLLAIALSLAASTAGAAAPPHEAVAGTGVSAGLCVLLGGDGEQAVALCSQGPMLVHALATDEQACDRARRVVAEAGRYGFASVGTWRGPGRLPYADNLVNLLVADCDALGKAAPTEEEIVRALVPGRGAAWLKRQGKWAAVRKPMPKAFDGWEQYWHDATGNPMSRDEAVKPSTGLQWITGSQEQADDNGYRLSGGRLAYKRRVRNPKGDRPAAQLVCRDAFNGLPCWTRDMTQAGAFVSPMMGKLAPFVFTGDRIYTSIGIEGEPLVAFDAATGETVRTYDQAGASLARNDARSEPFRKAGFRGGAFMSGNLVVHDGLLIHAVGNELFVVDAATGAVKWQFKADDYLLLQKPTVNPDDAELYVVGCNKEETARAMGGGRNPGHRAAAVLAFDLRSGGRKWTTPIDDRHITHAVYGERTLVAYSAQCNGPEADEWIFGAIDTTNGTFRWRHEKPTWTGMTQRREAVIRDGRLYLLSHGMTVFDLKSGEMLRNFSTANSRCETSKATANYLVMAFSQFIDYKADPPRAMRAALSRGSCGSGFFPAYGMVHYLPNMCHCENGVRFHSTASSEPVLDPLPDDVRLVRGPAYGERDSRAANRDTDGDWPMFLHGPQRGGWNPAGPRGELAAAWSTVVQPPPAADGPLATDWLDTNDFIGPVSATAVADGLAVVAVREQHRVEGLDAASGAKKWSFTAGGRVVTPPTLHDGLCLFGCRDGWVYALRADTGRLAWRFLAAPYERNIVAFSQVESSWPLLGSLLIHDGLVVAVAGYHPVANGGIQVWALDPQTGAVKWHTPLRRTPEWVDVSKPGARIDQPHPTASKIGGFEANAVVNNLAYADGGHIRFSSAVLDAATGGLLEVTALKPHSKMPGRSRFEITSDRCPQYRRHYSTHGYFGPYGDGSQICATFSEAQTYVLCVGCAFSGTDAVVLESQRGEGLLRRYDTRKLVSRDVLQNKDTPTWSSVVDGELAARKKDQKFYAYSSLIVAGDVVLVGGRLKSQAGQNVPAPSLREVAEGVVKTFDLRTGAPLQTIELDAAPVVSGLAVAGGRLYATCEDGSVRCFSTVR